MPEIDREKVKYNELIDKYDELRRYNLNLFINRAYDWNALFLRVIGLDKEKRQLEQENEMLKKNVEYYKKQAEQTIEEQLECFISDNLSDFNKQFPTIREDEEE